MFEKTQKLSLKNLAVLPSYFDYIFAHLRQKLPLSKDGADNKKCIRMLRCIHKPCLHAAPHRIQTQLSARCTVPHCKLNIL